jgi:cyanophycin synthetase
MFDGRDYRLLVVSGRLAAASERVPAQVLADGVHTVAQLVAEVNRDPRRGDDHEKPLTRIRLDDVAMQTLASQQLSLADVPAAGTRVRLARTANLSTGGTARDVTASVHADIASMCERAARVIGLDICGIDLIAPDISQPLPRGGAGVIEVNAGPGIRMHHHPSEGDPRDAGGPIVDMLFPDGDQGRIPIVAITGTNGKTTTARMISHVFSAAGKTPGLTTTDGVYIDGRPVARGDMTGPRSARAVLGDPAVDVAVLETARGGIVKSGLGYDWSDVGVITNIQLDHIGQDGIKDIDDLIFIKSLIAERVREGGTLILNADDANTVALTDAPRVRRLQRKIVLFSLYPRRARIERHLAAGGTVYVPRNGWIVEATGSVLQPICRISEVPATLDGAARFNIANVLAAVAAARAMGVAADVIRQALGDFQPARENPGRANLYAVGSGYILLDYGHNPAAFDAVGRMTTRWRGRRVTGIVGLPGDRLDSVVRESAAIVARVFDRVFVREDHDLRGREPGELPALIAREIMQVRPTCSCVMVAAEKAALAAAVESMQPGELIVLFYDEFERAVAALEAAGAVPVSGGLKALERGTTDRARLPANEAADRLRRLTPQARHLKEVPCNRAG